MADPDLEAFILSVRNFAELPDATQNELLLFFLTQSGQKSSATAAEVAILREELHLRPYRTAQQFSEGVARKGGRPPRFVKRNRGYVLERSVRDQIQKLVSRPPSLVATGRDLRSILQRVAVEAQRDYLAEAIGCFEAGYLRAAVVMGWCLAYSVVRQWLFQNHLAELNRQMSTWKRPVTISRLADFDELTDRIVIDTARQVDILTKEEHKVLTSLLDRRNSYAHPTGRSISEAGAEVYVREVLDEVLLKFN